MYREREREAMNPTALSIGGCEHRTPGMEQRSTSTGQSSKHKHKHDSL